MSVKKSYINNKIKIIDRLWKAGTLCRDQLLRTAVYSCLCSVLTFKYSFQTIYSREMSRYLYKCDFDASLNTFPAEVMRLFQLVPICMICVSQTCRKGGSFSIGNLIIYVPVFKTRTCEYPEQSWPLPSLPSLPYHLCPIQALYQNRKIF